MFAYDVQRRLRCSVTDWQQHGFHSAVHIRLTGGQHRTEAESDEIQYSKVSIAVRNTRQS